MRIFVTNFPPETTFEDLKEWFGEYGKVADAIVMSGRRTFGFVRMPDEAAAERAIAALDGSLHGPEGDRRRLVVKQANARKSRRSVKSA